MSTTTKTNVTEEMMKPYEVSIDELNTFDNKAQDDEIAKRVLLIDIAQRKYGFDVSLCLTLFQYLCENYEEGEDMLIAVSVNTYEYEHKDISNDDIEWLKQFKIKNNEMYKPIVLCLYKDKTIDKDILSFAYRHSKNKKEFYAIAANLQTTRMDEKKQEG